MSDWPEIDEHDRLDVVEPKPGRVQRFLHGLKVAVGWTIAIPIILAVVLIVGGILWTVGEATGIDKTLSAPASVYLVLFVGLGIFLTLRDFHARTRRQLERLEQYERATQTRLDNLERMVARLQLQMRAEH